MKRFRNQILFTFTIIPLLGCMAPSCGHAIQNVNSVALVKDQCGPMHPPQCISDPDAIQKEIGLATEKNAVEKDLAEKLLNVVPIKLEMIKDYDFMAPGMVLVTPWTVTVRDGVSYIAGMHEREYCANHEYNAFGITNGKIVRLFYQSSSHYSYPEVYVCGCAPITCGGAEGREFQPLYHVPDGTTYDPKPLEVTYHIISIGYSKTTDCPMPP